MCTNKNSTVLRQDKKDLITPLIILIFHNQKVNKTDGIQTLGNKTLIVFFLPAQWEAIRGGRPRRTSLPLTLQRSRGSMNP